MKWKTVAIVGAVLFLAGFLLGFIPEYQRASKLAKQLETAQLESKLREIRELASLSYIERIEDELRSISGRFGTDVWPCQGSS